MPPVTVIVRLKIGIVSAQPSDKASGRQEWDTFAQDERHLAEQARKPREGDLQAEVEACAAERSDALPWRPRHHDIDPCWRHRRILVTQVALRFKPGLERIRDLRELIGGDSRALITKVHWRWFSTRLQEQPTPTAVSAS